MTRMLCRRSLLGLALAGSVFSSPREGAREAEVGSFGVLPAREPVGDGYLEPRQVVTETVSVLTQIVAPGSGGSSTTVSSTFTSSVLVTSSVSTTASSASATATSSTASSQPPNTANAASASASTSPTPTSTPSGGGGLSGGAIAGIVIGVVAALAIAAGLGYFFARRRKNSRRQDDANMPAFGQSQNQAPPQAMKEVTPAPYAGPSTGNGVYTTVTAGYQPAQQQVPHPQPTFSELPADSRQLQPPQPSYIQQAVPDSPHGRSELETRE